MSELRICRIPPSLLKSGHLDIKDEQYAESKDVLKISYHIQNQDVHIPIKTFGRPKIMFSSKISKFAGNIGIDLTLIFCINDFYLCDS